MVGDHNFRNVITRGRYSIMHRPGDPGEVVAALFDWHLWHLVDSYLVFFEERCATSNYTPLLSRTSIPLNAAGNG